MQRHHATGLLCAALLSACSSSAIPPLAPPSPATFTFARLAAAAAKLWPAWSELDHPGFKVHLPTRQIFHERKLLTIPGNDHPFELALGHYPNIADNGGYGRNWRSSLSGRLMEQPNGDVVIRDHEARDSLFRFNGSGYDSPVGCWALLEAIVGGWRLTHSSRWAYTYNQAGSWTGIDRPDGGTIVIERNATECPTRVLTPENREILFRYDTTHLRLADLTDWAGRSWRFGYDADGRLIRIDLPGGPQWTYTYDAAHRLTRITNPLGELGTVTYDAGGGATRIRTFDGDLLFAPNANVVETTARTGRRCDYHLNAGDQIERRVTHLAGGATEETQYVYDSTGRRTAQIFPDGAQYLWTFPAAADPRNLCNVITFRHRPSDSPASPDLVWTYTYRQNTDQPLSQLTPGGALTEWEYDAAGNNTLIRTPPVKTTLGLVRPETTYTFDGLNRRTSVNHPDGAIDRYEYSATQPKDELTRVILDEGPGNDPKTGQPRVNHTTTFLYDAVGRVVRETFGDGSFVARTYDERDNLLSLIDELGVTTTYVNDAIDNRIRRTRPFKDRTGAPVGTGNHISENVYDRFSRLTVIRELDGFGGTATKTFSYSGSREFTRKVDGVGQVQTILHDHLDRPISVTNAAGTTDQQTRTMAWNCYGDLTMMTDGVATTYTHVYDGYGREIMSNDGDGVTSEYEYDTDGRLTQRTVRNSGGGVASVERPFRDGMGNITRVERDRFTTGAPATVTEAVDYCYDVRNRRVLEVDARGAETRLCWNGAGRAVKRVESDPARTYDYSYDPRLRLVQRSETRGIKTLIHTYTYDVAGNIVAQRNPIGSGWDYEHDSLGRVRRQITVPGGARIDRVYDALGNLRSMNKTDGVTSLQSTYSYDAMNRLVRADEDDGRTFKYTYDLLGRVTDVAINDTVVSRYTYDAVDRIKTRSYPGGATITYLYDQRGYVTRRSTSTGISQDLTIDALGRITRAVEGTNTVDRVYDSLGNLLEDKQNGAGVTKTFENGGTLKSLLTNNGRTYALTSDIGGRLKQLDMDGTTVNYTYDAGTRKVTKQSHPNLVSEYVYDDLGRRVNAKHTANAVPQSEWTATWNRSGMLTRQARKDGSVLDIREYDFADRLTRHESGSTTTGVTTTFTYDPARSRPDTITSNLPALQQTNRTHNTTYNGIGQLSGLGPHLFAYDNNLNATGSIELRPAYASGYYDYTLDALGRVTEVRRRSDNSLVGSYQYDPFNRILRSVEEEFSGALTLQRSRFFDGCRIVAESPTSGPGFALSMIPDFASGGLGHMGSRFDAFAGVDLWELDCKNLPRELFNTNSLTTQERYDNFNPADTPHFEFPQATPFRGPPSLQTAGLIEGHFSSYSTGLQLSWALPPIDPGVGRPLGLPGPLPPMCNPLPRPQPFNPRPGGNGVGFLQGGGGLGANTFACDEAFARLCAAIDGFRKRNAALWDCTEKAGGIILKIRQQRRLIRQWEHQIDKIIDEKSGNYATRQVLGLADSLMDGAEFVITLGQSETLKKAGTEVAKKVLGELMSAGTKKSLDIKVEGSLLGELSIAVGQLLAGSTYEGEDARLQGEINIGIMLIVHATGKIRSLEDELGKLRAFKWLQRLNGETDHCPEAEAALAQASAWRDTRKKKKELAELKSEFRMLTRGS